MGYVSFEMDIVSIAKKLDGDEMVEMINAFVDSELDAGRSIEVAVAKISESLDDNAMEFLNELLGANKDT